ncbi:MAG: NAD-dependent epimerase/dehydratase family protein [Lachnospiraceae bacterium]|nr:NAD-dependent epimerase/dehydratase family protein [Lachnospiraceae bacterium]
MLEEKRIIVTGGAGFLGSHVVDLLKNENEVFVPRSKDYDLKDSEAVKQLFSDFSKTDLVIHAAADIGGIGYSSTHPGTQFYNNALINLNMVHESCLQGVDKFVGVGSVCEYPAVTPVPFQESELWNGYPVETNDAYGLTKRMMLAQCSAYQKQYGFHFIHLLPVNLYGPRDDFDIKNSHVIPALIRKIVYALDHQEKNVDVWGTGYESREFVYVEDAAEAIALAAELYEGSDPVNIGSGQEITIRELADMIKESLHYEGDFTYLDNGLGGQQRRLLDVTRAYEEFGFKARTSFCEGIKNTIQYYLDHQQELN